MKKLIAIVVIWLSFAASSFALAPTDFGAIIMIVAVLAALATLIVSKSDL
jgi:hypothetical protein